MTLSRGYTTGGEKKASRREVKQTAKNCPNETRNLITQTTRTPNKIHTPWVHTWAMDAT